MSVSVSASRESVHGFQTEVINLARAAVDSSAARFWLIEAEADESELVCFNVDNGTEVAYQSKYCDLDPMHPSRFEDQRVNVVCSNTLMPEDEWKQSSFYREFMAPRNYDHDVDVFFRREGRIVAVLSILRDDGIGSFVERELHLLRTMHPFLEATFNSLYRPQWQSHREHVCRKYTLTARELEVTEIAMAGASTKVIAKQLGVSIATVKTHLQHIFEKVGVHSTKELISLLYQEGRERAARVDCQFQPNG